MSPDHILLDAAFLCGFIAGTYDLKGDQGPPAYIQPYIDRIMAARAAAESPAPAEEGKPDPIPDAAKMINPAETAAGNHGAETRKKAETLQSEARNFTKPPPEKKQHGSKLLPHLAEIQKAHDGGENSASIGRRYQVSGQSIVNLLKASGHYHPQIRVQAKEARPSGN